ncbi:GntR family transcriptional regulator [Bradyrhizobium ontarionense]|uniref:GntR family transcriptional regulator n=1 Tax=Bradyrhizobium ontarionense TaxID=2898149 RepID=A0ABY3RLK3_9BRAD|nr:GntR family transcriptional regulator [Bradyrhizobium sp. A19]UFZ08356.1 GntR family transcriptional regulator [Bradyrhizobium sp. A19]
MAPLKTQPNLTERVYQRILSDIVGGELPESARLIQDDLAHDLGVSRQPVQQALLLLRNQGFVRDAPGRGLEVAPIDTDFIRNLYEIRAVAEGLACGLAATRGAERAAHEGPKLIEEGRRAEREHSVEKLIEADVKFHEFLYEISGNSVIQDTTQPHWLHLRRLMGEVLMRDETPRRIWDQHEEILQAVIAGDAQRAELLARQHITRTAGVLLARMTKQRERSAVPAQT